MKKITALMLAVCLVASLAACSRSPSTANPGKEPAVGAPQGTTPAPTQPTQPTQTQPTQPTQPTRKPVVFDDAVQTILEQRGGFPAVHHGANL